MKIAFGKYLHDLRTGIVTVARRHPVELVLMALCTVVAVLEAEGCWTLARIPAERALLLPVFAIIALVFNTLVGQGPWRKVYWVLWLPLVPLLLWPGADAWIHSVRFFVTIGVVLPLAVLLCRRATENNRFAADLLIYLRAAVLAVLFAVVTLGLFLAILWSSAYIFGFDEARWVTSLSRDMWIATLVFIIPALLLLMHDRWENTPWRSTHLVEVLVNYLLTPALMIYAAILYLYMAKIAVTWSLPRGGVAYMVFAFALVTLAAKIVHGLLEKQSAGWFYRGFSVVLLPAVVLFWAGAAHRIGDYGLTAERVYLLLCGVVMTLAVVLFFSKHTGRYFWLCAAALLLFAAVTYIPPLSPERIGLKSQTARFECYASELELLDADGQFIVRPVPLADTLRRDSYRELFEAMDYVVREDSTFKSRIGIEGDFVWTMKEKMLPQPLLAYVNGGNADAAPVCSVLLPENCRIEPLADYPVIVANLPTWGDEQSDDLRNDTLRVVLGGQPLLTISANELIQTQLSAVCCRNFDELYDLDEAAKTRLLDYRGENIRLIFQELKIERTDSAQYRLDDLTLELIMTR